LPASIASKLSVLATIPGPGLLFGLMLLAAIIGGHAARWLHVPRVVGFLVGGALLHATLNAIYASPDAAIALQQAVAPLKAIQDLALGLILFKIGNVFERSQLRSVGTRVWTISRFEIAATMLFVFAACSVAGWLTLRTTAFSDVVILALLLGLAGIATAPAATLFVLQEYEAKGPITDTILGLTGVNNVVCIVLFYIVFLVCAWAGWIEPSGAIAQHIVLAIALTTIGSIALGLVCGALISVTHAKLPMAESMLVFFALFILLGAGEKWLLEHLGLSFNFLLTALTIGAVFANVGIDSEKLNVALRNVGSPIFAGFFVLAGYSLHLENLARIGLLGSAYILARLCGKVVGCTFGTKRAQGPARAESSLGSALLCQAAVVIGLASFVSDNWNHPFAKQFSTIILGSVVVFELIGPLLVKRCVQHGGEVKLLTLLRRGADTPEEASMLKLTVRSMLRLFGLGRTDTVKNAGPVTVEHIMRTNVQFIPASASLDQVLHFIERSTYTHFPVCNEAGDLAGVIHFSDVRDVLYDPSLRDLVTAIDLADTSSPVVSPGTPLTELLGLFHEANVAALPVCEREGSRRVIGLVEQRDLLKTLHKTSNEA